MPREYRTRALVLRSFDRGESDRVLHLYTERLGRVSAIAKGALRSKRRFPGTLEIFSLLDARLVDPPRSSMLRLEAARTSRPLEGIADDLARFAVGCQFLELLDRLTAEGEANPELFRFAQGVLGVLCEEVPDRLFALLVLAKTLARLGYRPQLAACVECGAELRGQVGFAPSRGGALCPRCVSEEVVRVPARVLAALDLGIRTPLSRRAELGLAPAEVERAERAMLRFFQFHIGLELRTSEFLRAVLEPRRLDGPRGRGDTPRAAPRVAPSGDESDSEPAGRPGPPPAPDPRQKAVKLGESQADEDPARAQERSREQGRSREAPLPHPG